MAAPAGEAAAPPQFKLVLVGDGGTGKVRSTPRLSKWTSIHFTSSDPRAKDELHFIHMTNEEMKLTDTTDHLCKASFDG